MTIERRIIKFTRGTQADIPPRPSILAQLEAVTAGVRAIAEEKARAKQMVVERNTAINDGRVARAKDHIGRVMAMLRKRGDRWMRISEISEWLKAKHGADVHPVDLGKAMRRTPGAEWGEVRGRICWRAKRDA